MPDSFVDFLDRYGNSNPPEMIYRDGEDPIKWQKRLKSKLKRLMEPVPQRVKPEVQVVSSEKLVDHTRTLVRVPVNEFSTLTAYLLIPHGVHRNGKRAGIVVLHGHSTYGIDSICGVVEGTGEDSGRCAYALHAVKVGYVVIAPAWWGWRGRDGHRGLIGQDDKCNRVQTAASMYGLNVLALHIQDGQAALDVLTSLPEVDADRVGCLGNSYGGRMTMWLSIFDKRVKTCVVSGAMNTFRERSLKLSSCGIQYPYGLLRHADVPELLSLIAPRPMQLQSGAIDTLITCADRDKIEKTVRNMYKQLSAEAKLDHVIHPEGHLLVWEKASPFLSKHLNDNAEPARNPN